jgi:hypothetical protein
LYVVWACKDEAKASNAISKRLRGAGPREYLKQGPRPGRERIPRTETEIDRQDGGFGGMSMVCVRVFNSSGGIHPEGASLMPEWPGGRRFVKLFRWADGAQGSGAVARRWTAGNAPAA